MTANGRTFTGPLILTRDSAIRHIGACIIDSAITRSNGVLEQVIEMLLQRASENRKVQLTLVCIDDSYIRAHRHAAGAPRKMKKMRKRPESRAKASPGLWRHRLNHSIWPAAIVHATSAQKSNVH